MSYTNGKYKIDQPSYPSHREGTGRGKKNGLFYISKSYYTFRCWLFNIAIILVFTHASAQDAKTPYVPLDVKTSVDSFKNNVNVEFKIDSEEDVLVVVTDSLGITVFLENQFRFKGIYKKSIALPYKGKYTLKVMREKERTNKSIEVR